MRKREKTWVQKAKIVQESYYRATRHEAFGKTFYENLFFLSPKLQSYFKNTDFEHQEKALMHGLRFLMGFFDSKNQYAKNQVKRIALSHAKNALNIHPHSYYYWTEALIMTLKKFDPKWYDDMSYYAREVISAPIAFITSQYFHRSE